MRLRFRGLVRDFVLIFKVVYLKLNSLSVINLNWNLYEFKFS